MPYDARGLVHAIKGLGRALAHRTDSWANEYSGLGTARDKSTLSKLVYGRLFRPEFLDWVYVESDMARTIVSAIVEDALREGYELRRRGEDEPDLEAAKRAKEACDAAGVGAAVHEGAVWGRLHGRAAVLVLAPGAQDSPLPEGARVIDLLVVDKGELVPYAWYEDPMAPKFGQVEVYAYTPISGGPVSEAAQYVHESRLVLFGGLLTPKRIKQINEGADVSVLQPVYDLIKKEGGVFDSMCAIVADMSQGVIKMKGLIDAIAAGKSDDITTRITLMDQMRSVTRSILLDAEDEDFKYVERGTASGVADLIDKVWVRIAKAADMPVTRLMGVSPAGLNATGESDRKFWYDKVRSYQRKILAPALERLARLVTGQDYEVCFPDSEKPTQLEQAQEQQAVAATDGTYIDRGVLTPSEVAMVRFGKGHWTPGYDGIDMEAHEMALERETDELANPPEPESAGLDAGAPPRELPEEAALGANSRRFAEALRADVLRADEYYHSSRKVLELKPGLFSVTDDEDASKSYLEGDEGFVHRIKVPSGLRLADEDDIRAIAKEIDPDTPYSRGYEFIEEVPGVREKLKREYDGVKIDDETPDNARQHKTITVFDPVAAGVEIEHITSVDERGEEIEHDPEEATYGGEGGGSEGGEEHLVGPAHKGPRGGLYRFTRSGAKHYLSRVERQKDLGPVG